MPVTIPFADAAQPASARFRAVVARRMDPALPLTANTVATLNFLNFAR